MEWKFSIFYFQFSIEDRYIPNGYDYAAAATGCFMLRVFTESSYPVQSR